MKPTIKIFSTKPTNSLRIAIDPTNRSILARTTELSSSVNISFTVDKKSSTTNSVSVLKPIVRLSCE